MPICGLLANEPISHGRKFQSVKRDEDDDAERCEQRLTERGLVALHQPSALGKNLNHMSSAATRSAACSSDRGSRCA